MPLQEQHPTTDSYSSVVGTGENYLKRFGGYRWHYGARESVQFGA